MQSDEETDKILHVWNQADSPSTASAMKTECGIKAEENCSMLNHDGNLTGPSASGNRSLSGMKKHYSIKKEEDWIIVNLSESSSSDRPGFSPMNKNCGIGNEENWNTLNQAHNSPDSSAEGHHDLSGMKKQCATEKEDDWVIVNYSSDAASDHPGLSANNTKCGFKNDENSKSDNLPQSSASGHTCFFSGMNRQHDTKRERNWKIFDIISGNLNFNSLSDYLGVFGISKQRENKSQGFFQMFNTTVDLSDSSSASGHPGMSGMNKQSGIIKDENSNVLDSVSNNVPVSSASDDPDLSGWNEQCAIKNEVKLNIFNQANLPESSTSDRRGLSGLNNQCIDKNEDLIILDPISSDQPSFSGINKQYSIKNNENRKKLDLTNHLPDFSVSGLSGLSELNTSSGIKSEEKLIILNLPVSSDQPSLSGINEQYGIESEKKLNSPDLITDNFPDSSATNNSWSSGMNKNCGIKNNENWTILMESGNLPVSSDSDNPGTCGMNQQYGMKNDENLIVPDPISNNLPVCTYSDQPRLLCMYKEYGIETGKNLNILDLIRDPLPFSSPHEYWGLFGYSKQYQIKNQEHFNILNPAGNLPASDNPGLFRINKQSSIEKDICNILIQPYNLPQTSATNHTGLSEINEQSRNQPISVIKNKNSNPINNSPLSSSDHPGLSQLNEVWGIKNDEKWRVLADNIPVSSASDQLEKNWNVWNKADNIGQCSASGHPSLSGMGEHCGIRNEKILHSGRKPEGRICRSEIRSISFDSLKELVTKFPDEILLEISSSSSFKLLIEDPEIDVDRMALVITALGKVCTNNRRQTFYEFLNYMIGKTHFFVNAIRKFLNSFCLDSAEVYHVDSLSWLLVFLQQLLSILPAASSNVVFFLLPLLRAKYEIFLKNYSIYNGAMELLKDIEVHSEFLRKQSNSKIKTSSRKLALQLVKPPDSFRSLSILPTIDDLYPGAFLRPNIVKGKYFNTEHYLDVQYRLVREDFIRPLREGITKYRSLKQRRKSIRNCQDAKVYENVRIVKKEFVKGTMCYLVHFSDGGFSALNWKSNKCFLSGSLLCLSSDGFRTVLFASVARRDVEQLKSGLLLVQFEDNNTLDEFNIQRNFVVIETPAYFEAYRHNLKALQELNEDTLPLKQYIIDVKTDVGHPRYLDHLTTYDMRPLLVPMDSTHMKRIRTANGKMDFLYEFPDECDVAKSVEILSRSNWPSAADLNLENSQYLALKAALTREFAIIQGPPGTGKTYVGLRIVQVLLHNKGKWFAEETNSLPILVVCSTNHALDQFLEGMASFTDKIVRIGGGGKNEAIYRFQLTHLKKLLKRKNKLPERIQNNLENIEQQIKSAETDIKELSSVLLKCTKSIRSEEDLRNYIPQTQYLSLKSIMHDKDFGLYGDGLIVYHWLDICPSVDSTYFHNLTEDEVIDQEASFGCVVDNEIEGVADPDGKKQILKYIKNWLNKSKALSEREALKVRNVWNLELHQRWNLYKYWLEKFVDEKRNEYLTLQAVLKTLYEDLCETKAEEDIHAVKTADVLGMTTTGAAKYRHIVRSVNPQILVVEEAAEILESHIVTALAPNTQHVILIGDHKQLRPSTTVHKLAVQYDANVSLFERMVENKMDYVMLTMQHRMRPEITDLIVPYIYSGLRNHSSVTEYENIKGVGKNVYFVTHDHNETPEEDSKSKSNEHEAAFTIRLCNYLVQQGYNACQITVLTMYNGQLSVMQKMAEAFPMIMDVRFTVVDNYQGEENDIILVSLVRSNDGGDIGFLKVANRANVALSRAKKGFYCIGNFELLAEKNVLWNNVIETLKQKGNIGKSLPLLCQNHPDVSRAVSAGEHFDSMPEGGCTKLCEYRLPCDHVCPLMCHPYDREHLDVFCFKECNRKCENGHACPLKCYEKCDPCQFTVSYRHPECGHTVQFPCSKQSPNRTCGAECDRKFICGHACPKKCGEICPEFCSEIVTFTSPVCGHVVSVECYKKDLSGELMNSCIHPCDSVLECGHRCDGICSRCHQGRLHVTCRRPCRRTLICGHKCKSPCAESCPPCQLPCENGCVHRKCPRKCSEPCDVCLEKCEWRCEHAACASLCGELCDRAPCDEPCGRRLLKCGHSCIGFCGEPCPQECRVCDAEIVRERFFGTEDEYYARFVRLEGCNHIFEINSLKKWMKIKDDIVQMKVCPKCRTAIRRNLRFGNVVKEYLKSIEKVKMKIFGSVDRNKRLQQSLLSLVEGNEVFSSDHFSYLKYALTSRERRNIQEVTSTENVIKISLQLADISNFGPVSSVTEGISAVTRFVQSFKSWLFDFLRRDVFTASEQQLRQLSWEVHRLKLCKKFVDFTTEHPIQFPNPRFEECIRVLTSYCPFGESSVEKFAGSFRALQAIYGSPVTSISELEKDLNFKAMDLSVGHWYQCPKGHVYCISERESAAECCDECPAEIAGSSDELPSKNAEEHSLQNNVLHFSECHFIEESDAAAERFDKYPAETADSSDDPSSKNAEEFSLQSNVLHFSECHIIAELCDKCSDKTAGSCDELSSKNAEKLSLQNNALPFPGCHFIAKSDAPAERFDKCPAETADSSDYLLSKNAEELSLQNNVLHFSECHFIAESDAAAERFDNCPAETTGSSDDLSSKNADEFSLQSNVLDFSECHIIAELCDKCSDKTAGSSDELSSKNAEKLSLQNNVLHFSECHF